MKLPRFGVGFFAGLAVLLLLGAAGPLYVTTTTLNTASNALNTIVAANDTTTSNGLSARLVSNDTTTSNGVVALYSTAARSNAEAFVASSSGIGTNITLRGATHPSLMASRALVLNSSGNATNATGTPDGTKFLRDDNTYAVPAGGVGPTNANQFGASTTLTLMDGLLETNLNNYGFTRTYGTNQTSGEAAATNGFASYGTSNGRVALTDTNGTTNVVMTSDFGGALGAGTNAPQWALHVRSPNTNSLAVFDSGIAQVARIETNTVTLNVSMSAPTNTASHTTIAPANLHSITLGKGWTNDLGARADMVISVKYVDAATGDPALAFTNSVSGEAWTNQVAFGITGTYKELVIIPDISPSDTGSFTDLSGTGASVTFLGAWWKLK